MTGLEALEKELNLLQQQKSNLLHKQAHSKTDNEAKYWQFRIDKFNEKISNFETYKKSLKALEIIKEKTVSIFQLSCCKNVNEYNDLRFKFSEKLTQEEFNLLKEMLE